MRVRLEELMRRHLRSEKSPKTHQSFLGFRDWSKSIGGGGPEQRGGGSGGFEPCARGGSGNFKLPLGGWSPYFIT